jgi:hypothetical protein
MITFKEYILEERHESVSWIPPNSDEHDEVEYQLRGHRQKPFLPDWVANRLNELSDRGNWNKAMRKGKTVDFTRQTLQQVNNTDHWQNVNKDKQKRVLQMFKQHKDIEMPIILRNPTTGEHHLIAGNSRASYSTQILNKPVKAHVII